MESFEMRNPALLAWRSHLALPLLALGRRDEAVALARAEVELAREWGAPRAIGVALRVQGLVEGGEEGIRMLGDSLAALETSSAKLERARTLVELGGALGRASGRMDARVLLRQGLELAARSGSQPLIDQAQAELAAIGERPHRLVLSGAEALTASERRVADLAVEGLTSKSIAQTLFVTTKTVDVHLNNVYRKLGIGSRGELSEALSS
jgi:DNA-binding CsgD family transcriptional regulator